MKDSKEIILNKLKSSNLEKDDLEIEAKPDNGFDCPHSLLDSFLERLESVSGKGFVINDCEEFARMIKTFSVEKKWEKIYCSDIELSVLLENEEIVLLKEEPEKGNYDVAITKCESLISLTGSVLVSSGNGSGRKVYVTPDVHVVYAGFSQLKPFIKDGLKSVNNNPSWIGLITGPSRTADIEKTLVLGAHGPKELLVFIDKNC